MGVVIRIGIEKMADHALILCVVLSGLVFEELHAALAQGDRDFDSLVSEDEVFWRREEIANHLHPAERLIRVLDFGAHI